MADKKPPADNISFEDSGMGIGQNDDGTFNSFPASELRAKTAERREQEEAQEYAIQQSEAGFPEEGGDDGTEDLSDLDDIASLSGA